MRGFRPRLWPTLLTVPALLVLLGLGTWQVQRLHWKEALIAERQAGLAAPATDWTVQPGIERMTAFLETKTVWHPIGI